MPLTSPFNVLIPAALSMLTGNKSDELVLWLFRGVSALLFWLGAAVLLFDSARRNAFGWMATCRFWSGCLDWKPK